MNAKLQGLESGSVVGLTLVHALQDVGFACCRYIKFLISMLGRLCGNGEKFGCTFAAIQPDLRSNGQLLAVRGNVRGRRFEIVGRHRLVL